MLLKILKGKIHRAVVTKSDLHYEGSIGIDEEFLAKSGIIPYEHVEVYNITNGERFTTYAVPAKKGSGEIQIFGAAAHKVKKGHLLIICAFAFMKQRKAQGFLPSIVLLDKKNKIKKVSKGRAD